MMKFTFNFIILFNFYSNLSVAQTSPKTVELKNQGQPKNVKIQIKQDTAFESININYKQVQGESIFKSFTINLSPFNNSVSIISKSGQEMIFDCVPTDQSTKWNCLSGCEGGAFKLSFNKNTKFDLIKLEAFEIIERTCDGSDSAEDQVVKSEKALTYKIYEIKLQK